MSSPSMASAHDAKKEKVYSSTPILVADLIKSRRLRLSGSFTPVTANPPAIARRLVAVRGRVIERERWIPGVVGRGARPRARGLVVVPRSGSHIGRSLVLSKTRTCGTTSTDPEDRDANGCTHQADQRPIKNAHNTTHSHCEHELKYQTAVSSGHRHPVSSRLPKHASTAPLPSHAF